MDKFTPEQALEYIYASAHTQGLPTRSEAIEMLPEINQHFMIGVRQSSVKVINGQKVTAFVTKKFVSIEEMLVYLRESYQKKGTKEENVIEETAVDNEPNEIVRALRRAVFHVHPSQTLSLEDAIVKAVNTVISARMLVQSKEKLRVHIAGNVGSVTYGFVIKDKPKADAFTIPFVILRDTTSGSSDITYNGHLLTAIRPDDVTTIGRCIDEIIEFIKIRS